MTFTEQAKEQAQASWQGSFQHPFITELHEGTLSPMIFRYYLIQDHYYLKHFSQLYRLIAAQTQQPRLKKLLFMRTSHNFSHIGHKPSRCGFLRKENTKRERIYKKETTSIHITEKIAYIIYKKN